MDYLKKVLLDVFDLNADRASMEEISERIESGALLKGTNMAILILLLQFPFHNNFSAFMLSYEFSVTNNSFSYLHQKTAYLYITSFTNTLFY